MQKTVWRVLLLIGLCSLAVFLIDLPTIRWVGSTDVTIEFVITDADTGDPIEGAEVSVRATEDSSTESGEHLFSLRSDQHGSARYLRRDNRCGGARSRLGLTDTFAVYPPDWRVEVSAPGNVPAEPFVVGNHPRRSERTGPGQSRMLIPVALRKLP